MRGIWITVILIILLLYMAGCNGMDNFIEKTKEETNKKARYTIDLDESTTDTIEQLLDEGKADQLVFEGRVYKIKGNAPDDQKGEVIGFIGEDYYIDEDGKKWTESELRKPYIYANPENIREKKPMNYGMVYSIKGKDIGDRKEIIFALNQKLYKASLSVDK